MNNLLRTNCVICNNTIKNIYKLDKFPIKLETNISTTKYLYEELSFSICTSCNTIQLDKLVPLEELYNTSHNTQIVGNTWLKYYDLFKKKSCTMYFAESSGKKFSVPFDTPTASCVWDQCTLHNIMIY